MAPLSRSVAARAIFFVALACLLLNDHVLKGGGGAPAWLTGKLSDFAGLVVAPGLLALALRALGVRGERAAGTGCAVIGIGFVGLKTWPAFAAAFDAAASAVLRGVDPHMSSHTVVDASDLLALPVLVVAYRVACQLQVGRGLAMRVGLCVAAFACMATSQRRELIGPHWDLRAGTDLSFEPFEHGMLELRMGRASLEGSFELGLVVYAHDAEVTLVPRDIVAWLDGRRVPARIGSGAAATVIVPARDARATCVHFAIVPARSELEALQEFDSDFRPRTGRLSVPLRVDETTRVVDVPLVFEPHQLRGHGPNRFDLGPVP